MSEIKSAMTISAVTLKFLFKKYKIIYIRDSFAKTDHWLVYAAKNSGGGKCIFVWIDFLKIYIIIQVSCRIQYTTIPHHQDHPQY